MSYNDDSRRACIAYCKDTFSACMKAALHCLNGRGFAPNDRCITILMACAEACHCCLGFTAAGTQVQRKAFAACAELCADCIRLCETMSDAVLDDGIRRCRECEALCRTIAGPTLVMAV